MEKIIKMFLFVICLFHVLTLCACSSDKYVEKRWIYDGITSIEFNEELDDFIKDDYLKEYGVETIGELEAVLKNHFEENNEFIDFYIYFDGKYAKYYNSSTNTEVTNFFREIDGEVVLAFSETQYEVENPEINLDPIISPRFVVADDGKTATFTYYCISYFVTINCIPE